MNDDDDAAAGLSTALTLTTDHCGFGPRPSIAGGPYLAITFGTLRGSWLFDLKEFDSICVAAIGTLFSSVCSPFFLLLVLSAFFSRVRAMSEHSIYPASENEESWLAALPNVSHPLDSLHVLSDACLCKGQKRSMNVWSFTQPTDKCKQQKLVACATAEFSVPAHQRM